LPLVCEKQKFAPKARLSPTYLNLHAPKHNRGQAAVSNQNVFYILQNVKGILATVNCFHGFFDEKF
jgi:hypothetical protein